MSDKTLRPGPREPHRTHVFQERIHDAYRSDAKLPTPTCCPDCGAVYANGRWQWLTAPPEAHSERCPACRRIHDRFPAGRVRIEGPFAAAHRGELIELVRNLEAKERAEHPLQRVMDIGDEEGALVVTTTDSHLAHGIGEALRRAYKGELDSHHNTADNFANVRWSRGRGA